MARSNRYHDDEEDDDNVFAADDNDYENNNGRPTQSSAAYDDPIPDEQPRREFKYSTANLREEGNCKKYCKILCIFLLFALIMIALSLLMQYLFFGDTSDNRLVVPEKNPNATFPLDKSDIDGRCARGNLYSVKNDAPDARGRAACFKDCGFQYFECCDPYGEFGVLNVSEFKNVTPSNNKTAEDFANCTFDQNVVGCNNYAKCQALANSVKAAPASLPVLCSSEQIDTDPDRCERLCEPVKCCYALDSSNCVADDLDICMDYAPCQNLKKQHKLVVPVASVNLDENCAKGNRQCLDECKIASCCGDSESACFQNNFIACLSYGPCAEVTTTKLKVAPIYSKMARAPTEELKEACGDYHTALSKADHDKEKADTVAKPARESCETLCKPAEGCWGKSADTNHFFDDPLGCYAWIQHCQVLF